MANLIGTVLDERYRITDEVARGGMGAVFRGERLKLGRAVAIKFLLSWTDSSEARARFDREARAMGQLHHPNVVTVTDFGVHEGTPYLVMDFIHGVELWDVIEEGPMSIERAVHITNSILAALAHAHDLGIVHRDIKPGNVMVHERAGFDDEVKLLDFGVARLHGEGSDLTHGMAIGTPAYMAPEQAMGAPVDARTDLYAVGVLLYQMVTGMRPYEDDDKLAVLRMHREAPRPTLARYPELEPVVQKAMAIDPAERFQTAAEMAEALRATTAVDPFDAADTVPAPPLPAPTPMPTPVPPLPAPAHSAPAHPAPAHPPTPHPAPMEPTAAHHPVDRRWLIGGAIGAGLLIMIIALVARNSGNTAPISAGGAKPAATEATAPSPRGEVPGLAEAVAVAARDNRRGCKMLEDLARAHPDSARVRYELGKAYLERPWWPRGFEAYGDAIERDPSLAADPQIVRDALRGLSSSSSHELAQRFLIDRVGEHALAALDELADSTRNKKLAERAREVSERIRGSGSTP